jgi:hypothetical protein
MSAWSDAHRPTLSCVMIAFGISAHLALIWAWPYPPILDWPNHMARHYLEARALQGSSLPVGYEISYSLMPNLGADLTVPVLLRMFPLTVASRLFLTFNVLVCWLGFALFVGRQAAKSTNAYAASLLVLPWLLTGAFFSGFLNYTSGMGLTFLIFLNYLRLYEKDRAPKIQLVLHGGLIALLYVWHLAALGVYVILHASHLMTHVLNNPRSSITRPEVRGKTFSGLALLLPAGALIVTQKLMAAPMALEGAIIWRSATSKLTTAIAFISSYDVAADIVVVALWVSALVSMARIEMLRRTQFDWLHIATFVFLTLYIVLPLNLGTTWAVDTRALVPLLVCCIALVARMPGRRVLTGAALALIATLIHVGAIAVAWAGFAEVNAQHLNFIRQLPVGARILGVQFPDVSRFKNDAHVIAWAVPERQAMVSSLFAIAGQQPLRVTVNTMGPFTQFTHEGMEFDVRRIRAAAFDYVWCFNPEGRAVVVPAGWSRVYSSSSITMWKIG